MSLNVRESKIFRKHARIIIYNVYKYMEKEAKEGAKNVRHVEIRTAQATKVSLKTIRTIKNEGDTGDFLMTPEKNGSKQDSDTKPDDASKAAIKRCIYDFILTNKELPTLAKLLTKLKRNDDFKGSHASLRRILKELGFIWQNTTNKKKALIEKFNNRLQRINYLQQIKEYKEQGRPIVFVGWDCILEQKIKVNVSNKAKKIFALHAGSEDGFIPNAFAMFMADPLNTSSEQMKFEIYDNWFRVQLMPNLPLNSVLVLDDSFHHNKEQDATPFSNANIVDMQNWLKSKNIPFESDMYKPQLYQLIKANKNRFRKYYFDEILSKHGHDVIRLPPGNSELNPMKMLFSAVKDHVASKKIEWTYTSVMEAITEKLNIMAHYEWQQLYKIIEKREDEFRKCEYIIDRLTDDLVTTGDESDNNDSENNDESSDEEDIIHDSDSGSNADSTDLNKIPVSVNNIGLYHFYRR